LIEVVKKDGKKELFDENKIVRSIKKAAIDADYNLEKIENVNTNIINDIKEVANKNNEISTESIKTIIFNKLDETESSIVESWKNFDKKYKP
jgi:transcriptional regulator NrdR family protein